MARRRARRSSKPKAIAPGASGGLTLKEHQGYFYALKDTPLRVMSGAKACLGHIYDGRLMVREDALSSALHTLNFSGYSVEVERAKSGLAA